MIGDNLAVGAAIAILCRSPRLGLKALVWIGTALICIPGLILLVLSNAGSTLKGDALGASLGYSMLELITGGMLILTLYAYRATPIPERTSASFSSSVRLATDSTSSICSVAMLYDRLFGDALPDPCRCSADSLRDSKRYCGRARHPLEAILRESNHAP